MNTISKSQRRKQRLLKKGAQLSAGKELVVFSTTGSNQNSNSNNNNSRRRRNRNRRRRQRNNRVRSSGLTNQADWLASLVDPVNKVGVKVPDIIAYPTGTFQLTFHGSLPTGAGGNAVGLCIYPMIGTGATVFPITAYNGTATNSLSSYVGHDWVERAAISALYSLYRPVSCCVDVYWIGTEQTRSGEYAAGCTWFSGVANANPGTTFTAFESKPEMELFGLPYDGFRVLWKPLDNSNLNFATVSGPIGTSGNPYYPQILVAATGLPAAATNLAFTVTCNFEGIPDSDHANIVDIEPSPFDTNALRKAWEWAAQTGNTVVRAIEMVDSTSRLLTGTGVVGNAMRYMGADYPQLPQRIPRTSRRNRSSIGGTMASAMASQMSKIEKEVDRDDEFDKEEESDSEFEVAYKKLDALSLTKKGSSPGGSPSFKARKDFGQKEG